MPASPLSYAIVYCPSCKNHLEAETKKEATSTSLTFYCKTCGVSLSENTVRDNLIISYRQAIEERLSGDDPTISAVRAKEIEKFEESRPVVLPYSVWTHPQYIAEQSSIEAAKSGGVQHYRSLGIDYDITADKTLLRLFRTDKNGNALPCTCHESVIDPTFIFYQRMTSAADEAMQIYDICVHCGNAHPRSK